MGLMEMAMNIAQNNSDKIAKVINRNPQEVRNALEQSKKIIPEILNDPTPDGGAKLLSNIGVDKQFLDSMYRKYSPYASKIPGLNQSKVSNALNAIEKAMDNSNQIPNYKNPNTINFDKSKYPKV